MISFSWLHAPSHKRTAAIGHLVEQGIEPLSGQFGQGREQAAADEPQECLVRLFELGEVDRVLHDECDLARVVQERRVGDAPVARLETAARRLWAGNVEAQQRHDVGELAPGGGEMSLVGDGDVRGPE